MPLSNLNNKISKLSQSPGVYIFKDKKGGILYIGKAASLRSRVGSYFSIPLTPPLVRVEGKGGRPIEAMIDQVADIETRETDSVLEALILEANLVKKYQPKYNVRLKDDKSFVNIEITKEDFPRIFVSRPTLRKKYKVQKIFGPYTSAKSAREALKIIRKIFPYHAGQVGTEKGCLYAQIGLCPAPYDGKISKEDYQKIIKKIEMFLAGKKKRVISELEKEMDSAAKEENFEKAAEIRNRIFALKHIRDVALIFKETPLSQSLSPKGARESMEKIFRIEAYDISNIFGKYATGSMIVFTDGQVDKGEYRKFKIKTVEGINDVGMMKEVLRRRLQHKEWTLPNLIFIDGGIGQYNGAQSVIRETGLHIPIVALAKGPDRKGEKIFSSIPIKIDVNFIKAIRDEAHRFAIWYHRQLRRKGLLA